MNTNIIASYVMATVGGFTALALISYVTIKIIKYKKRHVLRYDSGLSLDQLVDLKLKVKAEEAKNHEFDETKPYSEKIQIGTEGLESYKREKKIKLCDEYGMG